MCLGGLASIGAVRDGDASAGTGELYAIDVAEGVAGDGRRARPAPASSTTTLGEKGFERATLGVLETGDWARRFTTGGLGMGRHDQHPSGCVLEPARASGATCLSCRHRGDPPPLVGSTADMLRPRRHGIDCRPDRPTGGRSRRCRRCCRDDLRCPTNPRVDRGRCQGSTPAQPLGKRRKCNVLGHPARRRLLDHRS